MFQTWDEELQNENEQIRTEMEKLKRCNRDIELKIRDERRERKRLEQELKKATSKIENTRST